MGKKWWRKLFLMMMMMMMMGVHTECGLHLSVNRNLENNKHTWLNIIEYDIYYAIHSSRAIWYFSWVSINTFSAATFTEMLLLIASLPIILTPRIWTMPSFWRFILMANSDVWTRFKSLQTNVQKQPVKLSFAPLSIALMST